jgi:quercetin dioxygenase-like cupin family protein
MIFSDFKMKEEYHPKGWGFEYWIVNNEKYCGKMLYFTGDHKCSWHYHKIKDETFFVQSGNFLVYTSWDDDLDNAVGRILRPGDSLHIPPGLRHQMKAIDQDAVMYEFSTEHLEEDSYRIIKGD